MAFRICTRCSLRMGILPSGLVEQSLPNRLVPPILQQSTGPRSMFVREYASKAKKHASKGPSLHNRNLPSKPKHPPSNATKTTTTPTTTTTPLTPTQAQTVPEPTAYVSREELYAQTLAQRLSPTLLYMGPASHAYQWACIGISGWCLSYGAWHLYDAYFIDHPGLLWIVPHLMAGVAVFVAGAGVWVGLGAKGHLTSITAIPPTAMRLASSSAAAAAASKTTNSSAATLLLQAERRSLLPFGNRQHARIVECDVDEAQLQRRIKSIIAERQKEDAETRRQRLENSSVLRVLTSPIRDLYGLLSRSIARVIQREGFATVYLNGRKFKIDTRNGWLLDSGAAIDRLFKPRL